MPLKSELFVSHSERKIHSMRKNRKTQASTIKINDTHVPPSRCFPAHAPRHAPCTRLRAASSCVSDKNSDRESLTNLVCFFLAPAWAIPALGRKPHGRDGATHAPHTRRERLTTSTCLFVSSRLGSGGGMFSCPRDWVQAGGCSGDTGHLLTQARSDRRVTLSTPTPYISRQPCLARSRSQSRCCWRDCMPHV